MDFFTIKSYAEKRFTEKKSEFIGYAKPVKTVEEATDFIAEIKALHKRATHNCSAFCIRNGNIQRYSDDGEPQGTAGIPILEVIKKEELFDICIVVTRYFGGILLGGGGLVRAYSAAAKLAIDEAEVINMCEAHQLKIKSDYSDYGKITYVLPNYEVAIVDTIFTDDVEIIVNVKEKFVKALEKNLVELSNGKVSIDISDKFHIFFAV